MIVMGMSPYQLADPSATDPLSNGIRSIVPGGVVGSEGTPSQFINELRTFFEGFETAELSTETGIPSDSLGRAVNSIQRDIMGAYNRLISPVEEISEAIGNSTELEVLIVPDAGAERAVLTKCVKELFSGFVLRADQELPVAGPRIERITHQVMSELPEVNGADGRMWKLALKESINRVDESIQQEDLLLFVDTDTFSDE